MFDPQRWGVPAEKIKGLGPKLRVYLAQPTVGVPEPKPGKKGRKPEQSQALNGVRSRSVKQVGQAEDTHWQRLLIRTNERGVAEDYFAARQVWI